MNFRAIVGTDHEPTVDDLLVWICDHDLSSVDITSGWGGKDGPAWCVELTAYRPEEWEGFWNGYMLAWHRTVLDAVREAVATLIDPTFDLDTAARTMNEQIARTHTCEGADQRWHPPSGQS